MSSGDTVGTVADRGKFNLDEIIFKLSDGKQRATSGAVAALLGVPAQGLMSGRPKSHRDSWIVASGTGIPTGYGNSSIDPACLEQIKAGERHFISDARTLERWLESA